MIEYRVVNEEDDTQTSPGTTLAEAVGRSEYMNDWSKQVPSPGSRFRNMKYRVQWRGTNDEWHDYVEPTGDFYINMGRWADSIIGPFVTTQDADDYIDGLNYRGTRPSICAIASPKPMGSHAVTCSFDGVTFTSTVKAQTRQAAVNRVHSAFATLYAARAGAGVYYAVEGDTNTFYGQVQS